MRRNQLGILSVAATCLLFAPGGWCVDLAIPAESSGQPARAANEDSLAKFYEQPAPFQPHPPALGRPAQWFLDNVKNLKLDSQVYHGRREEQAKADGELPYRYRDAASQPELPFDKIVLVKRFTYHSSHFYTDFLDGCSRYGGTHSSI